jgi:polysaccharide deacetylase family protein (PEP-CTERM system associated)
MINFLTFDLEEYFHGMAFSHVPSSDWKNFKPRILGNVDKLLSILGTQKATFFVLGWIAQEYPGMLREIYAQGHEIACHSYMHRQIWDLSPKDFREDLIAAKKESEDIIGAEIIGFRAPTFSIVKETLWALPILRDSGFKYDSSIFPIHHDRYGISDFPRQPFRILNDFWEIPLSTIRLGGINIPFGGGGYFRLYPYSLTDFCIRKINRGKMPLVFFQHPWELDELNLASIAQPKSAFALWRRSLALNSPENKLKKIAAELRIFPDPRLSLGNE